MEITELMINAVRAHVPAPCSRAQARKAVEGVLRALDVQIEQTHEAWCQGCNAPHQLKGDE
jgi:hypothetical protein